MRSPPASAAGSGGRRAVAGRSGQIAADQDEHRRSPPHQYHRRGKSRNGDGDPPRVMFSFTDCARYVIDRAHFAGNSWGGMIGGTFAALYPDRLNRAVLMNCTASKAGVAQKIRYAA